MNKPDSELLSVDELMAGARAVSGVDIEDVDAVEPLTRIVRAYNEEVEFHQQGYQFAHDYLLRFLSNRLRMQRDFAAHPEIEDQAINAPLIICGMPRTGSTLLHKMLAASGDFNYLTFWQSLNPASYTGIANEDVSARIADSDQVEAYLNSNAPGLQNMHRLSTHEPEEELFLMQHCLRMGIFGVANVPSFMQWCLEINSIQFQMAQLEKTLKYLQWQGLASSDKRWLLKAPFYMGMEAVLKATFPDASLLVTHRHPSQVLPSLAKLSEVTNQTVSNAPIDPFVFIAGSAFQVGQHIANRDQFDMVDIDFRQLLDSSETVLEQIYAGAGQPLPDHSLQKMLAWKESSAAHAKGKVSYSLADYGLTEAAIGEQFKAYIELLETLFG